MGSTRFFRDVNGIYLWVDPYYYTKMNTRLVMDKAGRVVIPKPLRKQLQLEPGDALELESGGEQITLRPARGVGPLRNEHGIWVFHTGHPFPASATAGLLGQIPEKRAWATLGDGFVGEARPASSNPANRTS